MIKAKVKGGDKRKEFWDLAELWLEYFYCGLNALALCGSGDARSSDLCRG